MGNIPILTTRISRPRRLAMASCFVALGCLWGWTANERRAMEREMAPHVDQSLKEFTSPGLESRAVLHVSRDYVVSGTARAKVEVFHWDKKMEEIVPEMLELHYVREGSEWVREGSGRCTDESCIVEAKSLFAAHKNSK